MFPFRSYQPYNNIYNTPSYAQPNSEYYRALAEEQAARQAYTDALRAQEEARTRAARARSARRAYEQSHSSWLSDEDEDTTDSIWPPRSRQYDAYRPRQSYSLFPEATQLEEQRRRELEAQRRREAIELERARERERIRQLEEEERRRLLEQERRRRVLLEEELKRQREAEEREQADMRRRLQEEYQRRQSLNPFEEFFGVRPSRSMQPEQPHSHRARTVSPPQARRGEPFTQPAQPRSTAANQGPFSGWPWEQKLSTPPHTTTPPKPAATNPPTPPRVPTPPQPKPTPEQTSAAEKIQETWRAHNERRKALASISRIAKAFESAKGSFSLPPILDYQNGADFTAHVSVPTSGVVPLPPSRAALDSDSESEAETPRAPKLAYTPTNAPVHVYEEELNRLLVQLDEVQSGGDVAVRNKRRELARRVEREAQRVERLKVAVWRAHEAQSEPFAEEEQMAVEPTEEFAAPDHDEAPAESAEARMDVDAPSEEPSNSQHEAEEAQEAESILIPTSIPTTDTTAPIEPSGPEDITIHAPAPTSESEPPTALPSLVHADSESHSDSGETELETPVLEQSELPAKPSAPVRIEVVDKDAKGEKEDDEAVVHAPTPRKPSMSTTADRLAALRPLFRDEWDSVDDFDLF